MAYGRYSRRSYRPRRYGRPRSRGKAYLQLRGSQPPRVVYARPRRAVRVRSVRQSPVNDRKISGTGHGDKYIMAQADPFDEEVDGVKIPDANAQPSVPLKAEDTVDFVLGATETCHARAFNPTCAASSVMIVTFNTNPTSWSWPANFGNITDSAKLTQLRSDFEMFRPVAHAIRITSGLAPTAATGFVHVCVFSQALYNQSTWAYPTSIALMQNVPGYKRIPIGRLTAEGLTVVNRCLDATSQRYVDTDSPVYANAGTMEFQSGLQWGSIIVAVTGAGNSTTPITIESIQHHECIPRATAISSSTAAAKYNVAALAAATNGMSKTSPSALDSEKKARKATLVGHALNVLQGVGGAGKLPRLGPKGRFKVGNMPKTVTREGYVANRAGGIRNNVTQGM